ncbi:MAG: hypothetical protein JWN30_946 [Bacilli bacterium]|nr:hypothetical protein [Bacilli bacterium]
MTQQGKITAIEEALAALGVTESTLTADEKHALDEQGYVVFHDLIDQETLEKLRNKYEELMEKEGNSAGTEFHQEAGARRLSDLVNKGEAFDLCYTHPKLLAVAYHVIGRAFKLHSINGRDALPGQGHQGMHSDWKGREENEPYHAINTIWLLDDFTVENGATRFVPGTHKLAGRPADYMQDTQAAHPEEQLVIAKAGAVFAYNVHLWHGGTLNRTSQTRRVLHPSFVAREFKQQLNQREYIRKSTYDRISPAARYLLDVD